MCIRDSPWVGLLCGCAAGVFLALILGVLAIYCNGQQIVIGIGLNPVSYTHLDVYKRQRLRDAYSGCKYAAGHISDAEKIYSADYMP